VPIICVRATQFGSVPIVLQGPSTRVRTHCTIALHSNFELSVRVRCRPSETGVQCTHSPTLRINLVKGGVVSVWGPRRN